jgi:c-di-AMP phosphodiesterase-like protein
MRGGGHFDAAGAQVSGRNMNETLVILKSAINSYLDE